MIKFNMNKFLSFVFVFFFIWGCTSQCQRQRQEEDNTTTSLEKMGLQRIVNSPPINGRIDYVLYAKDHYGNCYMIIHNANTYGYVRTPATIPCSSVEKEK